MELKELLSLKEANQLDIFLRLKDTFNCKNKGIYEDGVFNFQTDIEETLRGNKAAAVRVRSELSDLRLLCSILRDKVQQSIDPKVNKSSLDTAIFDEKVKVAKVYLKKDLDKFNFEELLKKYPGKIIKKHFTQNDIFIMETCDLIINNPFNISEILQERLKK